MHASEDQILIRDAAESFLGDVSSSAAVRAAMARPEGHDPAVWGRIRSELGWCGLAIPEAFGGLGLGAPELVLLLEQAGRHLLCHSTMPLLRPALVALTLLATATASAQTAPAPASNPASPTGTSHRPAPLLAWRIWASSCQAA